MLEIIWEKVKKINEEIWEVEEKKLLLINEMKLLKEKINGM